MLGGGQIFASLEPSPKSMVQFLFPCYLIGLFYLEKLLPPSRQAQKKPGSISIKNYVFKACCGEGKFLPPSSLAQKAWLNFSFRAISLKLFPAHIFGSLSPTQKNSLIS